MAPAPPDPIKLAAEVVAAYVSNNPVPKSDLPDLILAVHSSLARLGSEPEQALPQAEAKPPAVPIRKSITPDYLICLEDGKRFRSMRRHLRGLGITPEQYREKWKLPSDYPWSRQATRPIDRLWRRRWGWVRNERLVDSCSIFGTSHQLPRGVTRYLHDWADRTRKLAPV